MKQKLIVSIDKETLRKARMVAIRRGMSVSGLLVQLVEDLVREEEAYERAECHALAFLQQGFSLRSVIQANRDELHER